MTQLFLKTRSLILAIWFQASLRDGYGLGYPMLGDKQRKHEPVDPSEVLSGFLSGPPSWAPFCSDLGLPGK